MNIFENIVPDNERVFRECLALKVTGLVKHFGKVKAVDDLNLEVNKGEFFALLGPSASGKTTFFRIICGIEKPDAGAVELNGFDMADVATRDRGVAMVFQTFALYPHLTVHDNLAFPLLQSFSSDEIENRIGEISELLNLSHTLERKPGTTSGGEQQRIAIARVLIRKPELLLLDEPLTNLDAKLRHDTRIEFKRIHRERDITIVYSTPDELEALTMGERIGVLRDGKMVQVGTPDDLYDLPDNIYTAGMVGFPRMNFIEGVKNNRDHDACVAVSFGEYSAKAWSNPLSKFSKGEAITFGIRPYEIVIVEKCADFNGPTFGAKIYLTEPLGDIVIFDLVVGEERLKMVVPEERATAYQAGDSLTCGFDIETTHVFARETGTAIR